RQGIRHRHADVVGAAPANHVEGEVNVIERFSWIAKLQEESDLNALSMQPARGRVDLLDARSFLHPVKNALRARFGANPHGPAPRSTKRPDRRLGDSIRAHQTLEGNEALSFGDD